MKNSLQGYGMRNPNWSDLACLGDCFLAVDNQGGLLTLNLATTAFVSIKNPINADKCMEQLVSKEQLGVSNTGELFSNINSFKNPLILSF